MVGDMQVLYLSQIDVFALNVWFIFGGVNRKISEN